MKIKSITYEKGNTKVYNFHCAPDENYYANGILVHNSTSQTPLLRVLI